MVFQLIEFETVPDNCSVRYECTNVSRLDNKPSDIKCSDLTFDGEFNGDPEDGQLTFSADKDDYLGKKYAPGTYEVTITG